MNNIIIFLMLGHLFFQITNAANGDGKLDGIVKPNEEEDEGEVDETDEDGEYKEPKLELTAVAHNKDAIYDVLKEWIKPPSNPNKRKKLLEIASGTGQHIAHLAPKFAFVDFQPTEYEKDFLIIIETYSEFAGGTNILPPRYLHVNRHYSHWANKTITEESLDYILNINMLHVTSYPCTMGLFMGSAHTLKLNGLLFTYGPFAINGTVTPLSNAHFDAGLRDTNRQWGFRDITQELIPLGHVVGFELVKTYDLPGHNKMLVWQKKVRKPNGSWTPPPESDSL